MSGFGSVKTVEKVICYTFFVVVIVKFSFETLSDLRSFLVVYSVQ